MTDNEELDAEKIWHDSFELADKYAGLFKSIIEDENNHEFRTSGIGKQIAHTNALFLVICFVNSEVLETELLDEAFKSCKRAMISYLRANQSNNLNS